ncbi:MAG: hypothetical protein LUC99_06325 [Clostridiales bacterium]|nr:hypothetical protein [Clostridiales bacterium]
MSNRDFAKTLIDQVPENKLLYAVYFLQGMIVPDETPNSETLKAIAEVDQMIQNGSGEHFTGSTADFFTMLNED